MVAFPVFLYLCCSTQAHTALCEEFVLSNRVTGCRCCFVVSPGDNVSSWHFLLGVVHRERRPRHEDQKRWGVGLGGNPTNMAFPRGASRFSSGSRLQTLSGVPWNPALHHYCRHSVCASGCTCIPFYDKCVGVERQHEADECCLAFFVPSCILLGRCLVDSYLRIAKGSREAGPLESHYHEPTAVFFFFFLYLVLLVRDALPSQRRSRLKRDMAE